MDKAVLRKIIENHLACLKGATFQDTCDRLCLKLYPNDYTPVRAGGPKGDTKNDGYCPKAKIYFAAHATMGEKTAATNKKIETDLKGCVENYNDVKTWIYLTNITLLGETQRFVNEQLRTRYSKLVIETWDHKKITEKILTLEQSDIKSVLELNIGVTVHLEAEIDNAARLLTDDKPQEACALLSRLWEQYGHDMNGHQKYRTLANIGHAYEQFDERQKAAEYFLKAKQYDPENEKARAREALAYLYLGNAKKAYRLAECFLEDFPENGLGRAVLVLSTPNEMEFDEVEKLVPEHQRNNPEVATSLGEVAMYRGHYDIAEKYTAQALKEKPDNPRIKEKLGTMLLCRARVTEQAVNDRGPTKEEEKYLQQAKSLFTEAFNDYQKQNLTTSMVRMLLQRANVYMGLNEYVMMDEDILFAYKLLPSDFEVVFRYASIKVKSEDWDGAISLLETLIGKGLRCSTELFLSQCLDKRNLEGDKERALELLRSRINDLDKEMPELHTEYLVTLFDLERQAQGIASAIKTLEVLPKNIANDELVMVLRGEAYRLNGNIPKALSEAKKIYKKMAPETSAQNKRGIATFLQAVGMYKEALELWKNIVQPEYIGRDTYRLMQCADQCEDINLIIEFTEKLRANGLWERKLFELEINYREKYNDDKGAKAVMEEFIGDPADQSYIPYVRVRLSCLGIRTGQKDLIEENPSKLPSVQETDAHTGSIVANILRHGPNPINGVEYAYELVRLNWNANEAHMAMIGSILAPIGPEVQINEPELVEPGVAVQYQEDDTQTLRWHIIEDSIVSKAESIRKEFPPEHPYSKEMLGKKPGECFDLQKGGIQERTATIKRLMSKYVYRFNDCLENYENRFPGQSAIKKVIIKDKEGKIDLSPMDQLVKKDAESVRKIEELYTNKLVPLYMVANLKSRHVLEAMQHIITTPNLRIKCCKGTDEEAEIAEHALRESENLVLDATAISTIFFLKAYDLFTKLSHQLFVSEGTVDGFQEMLRNYDNPKSMVGSYTENGFMPWSSEDLEEMGRNLKELIEKIKKYCKVESGLIIGDLESTRRTNLVKIFGQSGVESIMLSARTGYALWTDDLATAEIARLEFGCKRIWTQKTVDYFCEKDQLQMDFVDEVTVKLMHMSYYYTKPNARSLMKAVEKTQGDVDQGPLTQALDWFGDPNVKIEGKRYIGAMFIKSLWQSGHIESISQTITIKILEQLGGIPKGHNVVISWLNNINNIFGIDVINAAKVKQVIVIWLNSSQGTRIIIP